MKELPAPGALHIGTHMHLLLAQMLDLQPVMQCLKQFAHPDTSWPVNTFQHRPQPVNKLCILPAALSLGKPPETTPPLDQGCRRGPPPATASAPRNRLSCWIPSVGAPQVGSCHLASGAWFAGLSKEWWRTQIHGCPAAPFINTICC